jgi:tetratricopeptide (TPR) repeat protein
MIGETISHYKILEKLGGGGMGVVYKAEDTKLQRFVAIKVLPSHLTSDEEAKTRFVREARAASALEHPSICHIHEIGETPEGHLYMVMPCYEGETLGERIGRGPLEVEEALDIITQVASALARAHEKNIIHRDIKPGNVMLTGGGRQAKLMDFGLAKKLDATKLTRTGTTVGTVAYMSPEQVLGKKTDHRTDIWALGVVFYEMLTGRQPFQGDYEPAVLYSIINEEPEPVTGIRRDVPPGVENVVEKALSKDVAKRYQTTAELLADLEEQRDQIELGVRQRRFIKLRKKTRKRLLRVGLPAVLAAVAAFVLFVVQPFELEIRTKTRQAIAQENSIAIMFFENIADPADKGLMASIVKNALITDLGDSEYIRVIGEQQQHNILKRLGGEDLRRLDVSVASEVARLAEANWLLTGKILRLEPNYVITTEMSHTKTGEVRYPKVAGNVGEDLFPVIDRLTREIRADLKLPKEAEEEPDRAVADFTTHSEDAYRYYVQGMDYLRRGFGHEAKASFEKSLEYDSTFAMAHFRLTTRDINMDLIERERLLEAAVRHSDNASKKDRLYIKSAHARISGDLDQAVMHYETIVETYPYEREAYLELGSLYQRLGETEKALASYEKTLELDSTGAGVYARLYGIYRSLGEFEKAAWALDQNIALNPDHPDPYDTKAWFCAYRGRIDDAIEHFTEALERNPKYWISLAGLTSMYIFNREYEKARAYSRNLMKSSNVWEQGVGSQGMAYISLYQGKLADGLEILDIAISSEQQLAGYEGSQYAYKIFIRSLVYLEMGDLESAVAGANLFEEVCEEIGQEDFLALEGVYLFARLGEFSRADEILDAREKKINSKDRSQMSWYLFAKGWVEKERGNLDAACDYLENAVGNWYGSSGWWPQYSLALIYIDTKRFSEAVEVMEKAVNIYTWVLRMKRPARRKRRSRHTKNSSRSGRMPIRTSRRSPMPAGAWLCSRRDDDRRDHIPLQDPREARRGRDGGGVQGPGPDPGPFRCNQVSASAPERGRGGP